MLHDPDRKAGPDLDAAPRWLSTPRWYLWDSGFMLLSSSEGAVPHHEHHAIQIVVAVSGTVAIRGTGDDWRTAPGLVVLPNTVHSYNGNGATSAMLFVDPESAEGGWLKNSMSAGITLLPEARVRACAAGLAGFIDRPLEAPDVSEVVRHCVHVLCAGARPGRRVDIRVSRVLREIRQSDEPRLPLEKAAALAFLSPSRFAHLFKQQVGLPFRRYMLWRKLTRAMLVIGREQSITRAAHAAGFADAAHMTRTFYQMFGLPPSALMRGEFFEIASPFELTGAAVAAS